MPTYTNGDKVTALAARLRDEAIIPGGSLFTDRSLWTPENFQELKRAYVDRPDESAASFEMKLRTQLGDATDDAKVLFSELLLLNLMILGSVTDRHKIHLIQVPLEMIDGEAVSIPDDVTDVLVEGGVIHGGYGVNQYRWQAMAFLVEWGLAVASLSETERATLFSDSGGVERLVYRMGTETSSLSMQRSLCYLFDPAGHEPIISQDHLEKITGHFADRIPAELTEAHMQRQAAAIRKAVALERGDSEWDFYHDRDEWTQPVHASRADTTAPSLSLGEGDENAEEPSDSLVSVSFTDDLAGNLFVPQEWLDTVRAALNSKRQVILQGPPGTGKTYLARRLAKNATTAEEQVEIVQFHPAYTYEDFFEGFRPQAVEGGPVEFVLRPGPLRVLADRASDNPDKPYFLVIDEINRGNLAKIFGELYFLLEYRDDRVALMYSQDRFALPSNLFIIGTMNTADRSIALVDSAMRRRFAFFTLAPDREPTANVLARWAAASSDRDAQVARLLTALNNLIVDPQRMVGPSYLMQPDAHTKGGLERIWESEILPMLEENFFGDDDVAERFGLDAVRSSLAPVENAGTGTTEDDQATAP
ncbi:McrB family protein [Micrococcus endophyticus]|uniref:McrB family protein n=1 Tax=Micrococcus endophyticus TaxID=455343 RepID=UPI0037FE380D